MLQREAVPCPGRSIQLPIVVVGAALIATLSAVAMLAVQLSGAASTRVTFDATAIKAVEGHKFAYTPSVRPPVPGMVAQGDSLAHPSASLLTLTENGAVYGTAHSPHARIASDGGGLYSHWGATIYFSTRDNTDPRTNGRTYAAVIPFKTPTWVWLVALATGSMAAAILFPGLRGVGSIATHLDWRAIRLTTVVVGAALVAALSAVAMLAVQLSGAASTHVTFDVTAIKAVEGHAFAYTPSVGPPVPGMVAQGDSLEHPSASLLTLTENAAVYGTPHSSHDRIASDGGGLYSHWGPVIYFSTRDNTDPRTNGRTYGAVIRFKTPTWLWLVALAAASMAAWILFPGLRGDGSVTARLSLRDVLPVSLLVIVVLVQVLL